MSEKRQWNILVTAAGGPAGINALKLLSMHPHLKLHGTDIDPESKGKEFTHEFRTMAPFHERDAYRTELRQLIADWNIDVVIPTLADELHEIESVLEGLNVHVLVSPQETAARCVDKRQLYTWMSEYFPEYTAKWQTLGEPIGWEASEYFIKPIDGRGARGCRVVTGEEISELRATLPNPEQWIVMEVLPGTEWTVDAYVDREGSPVFIVPRERLEVVAGISRKGRAVRHERVIAQTRAVMERMRFYGPVCFQWKEAGDGSIKLVEINARLSGGLMITVAAGADPMRIFVCELAGEPLTEPDWKEGEFTGFTDFVRPR